MGKFIIALCCAILLAGVALADYGAMPENEKEEKKPEIFCPKTKISDNSLCLKCHTQPDFKLREAKPDRALELPFGISLTDGKLYYVIETINADKVAELFQYMYWHDEFKNVVLEIQSPGGSLLDAWKIIGLMDQAKKRGITVETRCYGFAFSAGFLIFVNGQIDHRYVAPTAEFMHHELWTLSFMKLDTPSSKEDEAKTMRHLQDTIHDWLITRATKPITKDELDNLVRHKDYWMNGKDMIALGFADEAI